MTAPTGAARHQLAALLQHTYRWTRAASAVAPPVAQQVAPALTAAVYLYEAQQYGGRARPAIGRRLDGAPGPPDLSRASPAVT